MLSFIQAKIDLIFDISHESKLTQPIEKTNQWISSLES
jgi:hypothetical protein